MSLSAAPQVCVPGVYTARRCYCDRLTLAERVLESVREAGWQNVGFFGIEKLSIRIAALGQYFQSGDPVNPLGLQCFTIHTYHVHAGACWGEGIAAELNARDLQQTALQGESLFEYLPQHIAAQGDKCIAILKRECIEKINAANVSCGKVSAKRGRWHQTDLSIGCPAQNVGEQIAQGRLLMIATHNRAIRVRNA
ncbi:MAG: hypothetical protein ACI87W_000988 [Halieaceae bacterium]|jgi:hypothetical protein